MNPNETTFQTHKRLTSQQPWVPFQLPSEPRNTLEDAECAFFEEEESKHNPHGAQLHSKQGVVPSRRPGTWKWQPDSKPVQVDMTLWC